MKESYNFQVKDKNCDECEAEVREKGGHARRRGGWCPYLFAFWEL